MKYFKVIDNKIYDPVSIDTETTNYSLTLEERSGYELFLQFVTQSPKNLGLPLDLYFIMNDHLAMFGTPYIRGLPKSKNGLFEIFDITSNKKHKNFFVKESKLIEIDEWFERNGISPFMDGIYLWEYICEKIRIDGHNEKPCRSKSFSLFDNISDCEYYIKKHKGGGEICQVELIEIQKLFKADMNLIDLIPNHSTYGEAEGNINDYWNRNSSNNPVYEFLFQGTCRLIPHPI